MDLLSKHQRCLDRGRQVVARRRELAAKLGPQLSVPNVFAEPNRVEPTAAYHEQLRAVARIMEILRAAGCPCKIEETLH